MEVDFSNVKYEVRWKCLNSLFFIQVQSTKQTSKKEMGKVEEILATDYLLNGTVLLSDTVVLAIL